MKNKIYFGDNLPILRELPEESIDLIYIDPPFNTGKTQKHTKIKTTRSNEGDRKGFLGEKYKTIELGTKSYRDEFNSRTDSQINDELEKAYSIMAPMGSIYFLEDFLFPRLQEAYRLLKPYGCLYFHIDYREVHYCKILLDRIFGRESFINEIIWAYDYGGKSKFRWPPKHDNILFYAKDPNNFIFNTNIADREFYMAPGLVGPEKADKKKLPTDVWWYGYVGRKKVLRVSDTWWNTIVATNSRERTGYPTQKPIKVIDRIIRTSTLPGNVVLDFFAGSGTLGASCIKNKRHFILIDNNRTAMEVMAERFSKKKNIEWHNFDPSKVQRNQPINYEINDEESDILYFDQDFKDIVIAANHFQKDLESQSDNWKDSPLEWILQLSSRTKGKLGRQLIISWLSNERFDIKNIKNSGETISINNKVFAIKFSTLWSKGFYKFQQIRNNDYDYLICLGISPDKAHCWIIPKEIVLKYATEQHKGATEFRIIFNPLMKDCWYKEYGGSLSLAKELLKKMINS